MASRNRGAALVTHEGAPAAALDPRADLERSVMACLLWESEFYESGETIATRIAALARLVPPAAVADIAVRARRDMRVRHAPLLLAVELLATAEGRALFGRVAEGVFARPDDLTEFLALYWRDGRRPLAKQAKRHLGEALRRFDEYQLAKYDNARKPIRPRDVLRLTRPVPDSPAQAELWGRLSRNELATPDTWEVELSKGGDRLGSWTRLLAERRLGGLALLRNLRNMLDAGVPADALREALSGLRPGRLLPANFLAAARHAPSLEPAIEEAMLRSLGDRPAAPGRTVLLVDVSGSMSSPLSGRSGLSRLDAACALAVLAREAFADLRVFTFTDRVVEVPPRRGFALRDAIDRSQPRGGTLLGAAVTAVPACDRLVVLTDEQSADAVPQRRGFMVNLASARNGVGYGTWTHIDGWSERVLDYILAAEAG